MVFRSEPNTEGQLGALPNLSVLIMQRLSLSSVLFYFFPVNELYIRWTGLSLSLFAVYLIP
jgi:hypothetical protein